MSIRARLLGFAFASADLLVELRPDGVVDLALGAGPAPSVGPAAFHGRPLAERIDATSAGIVADLLTNLKPGARFGPLDIVMDCGAGVIRRAWISGFRMPDLAPNISCCLSWQGPVFQSTAEGPPVLTATEFMARAHERLTHARGAEDLSVSFIDIGGFAALGEKDRRATARVEAALQSASLDGATAARVTPERYALLRNRADTHDIVGEVRELARHEGLALDVSGSDVSLAGKTPLNTLRALRFAIETCLKDNGLVTPEHSFNAALDRTVKEASAFSTMVKDRSFALHYQPIVDLKTRAVHHFEALTRFVGQSNPAPAIRMAEELALIEGFDLAVAEKAIQRLRKPGSGLLKIAINVSGASLSSNTYVDALLRMTASSVEDRRRLSVEVTETAAMADIEAANRRLSALRRTGMKVCIDDFGAGSASFDYLRGLSVDTVKIDGKFVQGLENDPRARTLISHLVELCGSLNVSTIAECIETEACATTLRDLGVGRGQGWLFGKAEAEPRTVMPTVSVARRHGAVEAWG